VVGESWPSSCYARSSARERAVAGLARRSGGGRVHPGGRPAADGPPPIADNSFLMKRPTIKSPAWCSTSACSSCSAVRLVGLHLHTGMAAVRPDPPAELHPADRANSRRLVGRDGPRRRGSQLSLSAGGDRAAVGRATPLTVPSDRSCQVRPGRRRPWRPGEPARQHLCRKSGGHALERGRDGHTLGQERRRRRGDDGRVQPRRERRVVGAADLQFPGRGRVDAGKGGDGSRSHGRERRPLDRSRIRWRTIFRAGCRSCRYRVPDRRGPERG